MSPPSMESQLTTESIDSLAGRMETSLERVRKVQGSRVKLNKAEVDLLMHLEQARDVMLFGLKKGDRAVLQEVFGGDCRRIARIRALVEAVKLSDMYKNDQRLPTCLKAIKSVEDVLKDLGHEHVLKEAGEAAKAELEQKQHEDDFEEPPKPLPEVPSTATQSHGISTAGGGNKTAACDFEVMPAAVDRATDGAESGAGHQDAACEFQVSHEQHTQSEGASGTHETGCEFTIAATAGKSSEGGSTNAGATAAECGFDVTAQAVASIDPTATSNDFAPPEVAPVDPIAEVADADPNAELSDPVPPEAAEASATGVGSANGSEEAKGVAASNASTAITVTPASLTTTLEADCPPSPQSTSGGGYAGKGAGGSPNRGYSVAATVLAPGGAKGAGYALASVRNSLMVPVEVTSVRRVSKTPSSGASTPQSSWALERLVKGNGMADKPEERKQVIVKGVETGELKALAFQIFTETVAPDSFLDWNSGKIATFITRVFERLKLPVPASSEMYALYTRFDADGNWALDADEGARLIEAAICSVCKIEASGHRERLVLAVQSGEIEELVARLFTTHDVQMRGALSWSTGEATAFIRAVFKSLNAPEPSDVQIGAMQRSFDSSGTGVLYQQQAVILVETLCRSLSHVESADQAMTCTSGHVMQLFATPMAGYSCDMCKSTFQANNALWECRSCNYHMCTVCAKQRRRRLSGAAPVP